MSNQPEDPIVARLDRLTDIAMSTAETVDILAGHMAELSRLAAKHEQEHEEYRADIERLYASFSEHLRHHNGDD